MYAVHCLFIFRPEVVDEPKLKKAEPAFVQGLPEALNHWNDSPGAFTARDVTTEYVGANQGTMPEDLDLYLSIEVDRTPQQANAMLEAEQTDASNSIGRVLATMLGLSAARISVQFKFVARAKPYRTQEGG